MKNKKEYNFNKERHIHTLNGKPLMGITSVLSVISKPALIQWSANMAVDYLQANWGKNGTDNWEQLCKEARVAHRKKRDKAGDWGTKVHEAIETTVVALIKENGGYAHGTILEAIEVTLKETNDLDDTQREVIRKFFKWAVENKITFLESEKNLYSEKMWTGGIVDLVFDWGGIKYIGDIKTSSGIYDEAFFQMGGYHLMLEEMGVKDIKKYLVINLKKDGTMDTKEKSDLKVNKEAFKHALGLYKIVNKNNQQKYVK